MVMQMISINIKTSNNRENNDRFVLNNSSQNNNINITNNVSNNKENN